MVNKVVHAFLLQFVDIMVSLLVFEIKNGFKKWNIKMLFSYCDMMKLPFADGMNFCIC